MKKLLIKSIDTTYNNRLILFKPIWNQSDVVLVYTKNGQNPLTTDYAFTASNFIPIDKSCLLQVVGMKVGEYSSPIYSYQIDMMDQRSTRVIQYVTEHRIEESSIRSDVYTNSSYITLSDNTTTRGRYLPNIEKLNEITNYKIVRVTGKYRDRLDLIAYDHLGDSSLWWIISEVNRDAIIDPLNVPIGIDLKIPSTNDLYKLGYLMRDTTPCDNLPYSV